jgi:hypothetical protein
VGGVGGACVGGLEGFSWGGVMFGRVACCQMMVGRFNSCTTGKAIPWVVGFRVVCVHSCDVHEFSEVRWVLFRKAGVVCMNKFFERCEEICSVVG